MADAGDDERLLPRRGGTRAAKEKARAMQTRHCLLAAGFAAMALFLIVPVVFIVADRPQKHGVATGGSAPADPAIIANAQKVFVHFEDVVRMQQLMQQLVDNCTPPQHPPDPVYNSIFCGTAAETAAGWAALRAYNDGTGLCNLYGLAIAELRAATTSTTADICYAYVDIGLQIISNYLNYTRPTTQQLIDAYNLAWPLNLFWGTTPGNDAVNVAANANQFITLFLTTNASIVSISQQFCNPYFASDTPAAYRSTMKPWLAHPFQGLITKTAKTYAQPSWTQTLGTFDPSIITPAGPFKTIYTIDYILEANPGMALFLDAVLGAAPVINKLTSLSTANAPSLAETLQNILLTLITPAGVYNNSATPIAILGEFTPGENVYTAFQSTPGTVFFAFAATAADIAADTNVPQNMMQSVSSLNMAVFDFITDQATEKNWGAPISTEKDVADILASVFLVPIYAGSNASAALLDTFAFYNSELGGVDVSGALAAASIMAALADANEFGGGVATNPLAFDLQSTTNFLPDEAAALGASGPPPAALDWRKQAPQCMYAPINQQSCSNCWAVGSTTAMNMRGCIANGLVAANRMSIAHVTTCSGVTNGCAPQSPAMGFTFMLNDVHSYACMPDVLTRGTAPGCQRACDSPTASLAIVNGVESGSFAWLNNPGDIVADLAANGPMAVGMTITSEFAQFYAGPTKAVFTPTRAAPVLFLHMVVLVGYTDTYWILLNSWGTNFGDSGFFYVVRNSAVMVGKYMWVETHAWRAVFRVGSSSPRAPTLPTTTTPATPTSAPVVVVAQNVPGVSAKRRQCSQIVINGTQATQDARIEGCPQQKIRTKHTSGAGGAPRPASVVVALVSALAIAAAAAAA